MDRREFINALATLIRDAADGGLPASDIIEGLESALRCETRMAAADTRTGYEPVGLAAIGVRF